MDLNFFFFDLQHKSSQWSEKEKGIGAEIFAPEAKRHLQQVNLSVHLKIPLAHTVSCERKQEVTALMQEVH